MMPAIYGNSYEIVQGPGYVAIWYEMVNELRVIPLDGRPHVGSAIRSYMGDARGHFEGDTLVVETTNFTDKVPYRGSSENLRLTERFTQRAPGIVEWSVTFDDPGHVDAAVDVRDEPHARRPSVPFEYACHEGNYAMRNMLGIARQEEATGRDVDASWQFRRVGSCKLIVDDRPRRIASQFFGHSAFRDGQQELVETVLDGHDLLAVMPTGSGKSLGFQLPALLLPGHDARRVAAHLADEGSGR